jgi:hypothetical protein
VAAVRHAHRLPVGAALAATRPPQGVPPVQVLDQMVFAHAFRTRAIPRPAAVLAMATSGAIVALDLKRRGGAQPPASTTS